MVCVMLGKAIQTKEAEERGTYQDGGAIWNILWAIRWNSEKYLREEES